MVHGYNRRVSLSQITEQLLYNKRRGSVDTAMVELRPGENKMIR